MEVLDSSESTDSRNFGQGKDAGGGVDVRHVG